MTETVSTDPTDAETDTDTDADTGIDVPQRDPPATDAGVSERVEAPPDEEAATVELCDDASAQTSPARATAERPDLRRCLDCDSEAPDLFCPRCGQETRERRAPFIELLRELFDHLSLDSKLPRSLYALLLQPGRLTEYYLAGRRTTYVKPLRMYLVLSVALFLLFSLQSPDVTNVNVYVGDQLIGEAKDGSENNLRVLSLDEDGEANSAFGRWASTKFSGQEGRFQQMNAQELVDRLYMGFQNNLPRALFIFLPMLALALKVLFLRSGALYFDHLIFSLHFQSFLFLLLALCWFFHSGWVYLGAGLVISPIYLLLAMYRTYGGRGRWIIPRWIVLVGAYLLMILMVVLGVALYVMATV